MAMSIFISVTNVTHVLVLLVPWFKGGRSELRSKRVISSIGCDDKCARLKKLHEPRFNRLVHIVILCARHRPKEPPS